jgi:hypothetical protein
VILKLLRRRTKVVKVQNQMERICLLVPMATQVAWMPFGILKMLRANRSAPGSLRRLALLTQLMGFPDPREPSELGLL